MNIEMNFGDKERLADTLSSQKNITSSYNTFTNECSNEKLMLTMMEILDDEHKIEHAIWKEMNSRGWYNTENAEQSKIEKEKNKFSNFCPQCKI